MKILIFSDACFNDNVFPMYKAFIQKGYDVTCLINLSNLKIGIFNIDKRINKQAIIKATDYSEIKVYEKYMKMDKVFFVNHCVDRKHPWRDVSRSIDVVTFIAKGNYDIIHTDMILSRSYKLLYYLYGYKMVLVQHDPFPHSGMEWSKRFKKDMILAYSKIKKIVILNSSQYDAFCRENALSSESVLVNSLGPLDCINLFTRESVKERRHNILFFGRIVKYKGIEYLCKSFTKVRDVIPDATLTIAGCGQFYFNIEEYDKCPYIEIYNHFIDEEDLAKYIQECSASICYYSDATQSGGVLTSFSLYKPVIASDINAMREIIKDGYNGILVPPCDPEQLSLAIIALLQDDEFRKKICENIKYEYMFGDRSWSKIVDKYIEFYQK